MKKKILFITTLPPPYYGASIVSEQCLNILKRSKKFVIKNIKLNYSKSMQDVGKINLSKLNGFFKVRKEITDALEEFQPDFVYFAPATSNLGLFRDFLFVKHIKKRHFPIIFHIHSRMFNLYGHFYKPLFRNEKAIILGRELISDIEKFVPEKNLFLLSNAIKNEVSNSEINKIMKMREKKKKTDILFLSNMDESKGWFKLLEACKILKEKGLEFHCNFVGAWTSKKGEMKFYSFVKSNNLGNFVSYLGKKIDKEKGEILKKSDIMAFPTEYRLETFGLVIIESMMYGLPVIANSISTIPSIIINQKTGFLLKENSPGEIAKYLETLIADKDLRKRMGLEGRKRFLRYYEMKNYEREFLKYLSSI